jgi:hypothetical protein
MVITNITTSTRSHATTSEVAADIERVNQAIANHGEETCLLDSSALAIAAGWQSPGTQGRAFAQLASTGTVSLDALAEDIDQARNQADPAELKALDLLLIWAFFHPSLMEA